VLGQLNDLAANKFKAAATVRLAGGPSKLLAAAPVLAVADAGEKQR